MCGLAGIFNLNGEKLDKLTLTRMMDQMIHRGPDGSGIYIDNENNIGLGHRRLSIIDLTSNASQPMSNEDGKLWMVANGEIYNYLELMTDLKQKGHLFKSRSDNEVIIHAYEEYGMDCLNYFNGMYSFALWDKKKKELFCARDRMGIKPFYYFCPPKGFFLFSSEIKGIIQDKRVTVESDISSLQEYLSFQFVLGDKTFFKNIKRLLPGHYLVFSEKGLRITQYWDIRFSHDNIYPEKWYHDELMHLLEDSVRLQLRSDVAYGTFLSGGIDSSTITGIAAKNSNSKIKSFTGFFNLGDKYDERRYSKIVATHFDTEQHNIEVDVKEFPESISKLIWYLDEPIAGPGLFPQYCVSKYASKYIKVALGGQGGDELFVGYHRYLRVLMEQTLTRKIKNNPLVSQNNNSVSFMSSVKNLFRVLSKREILIYLFFRAFQDLDKRYFNLLNLINSFDDFLNKDFLRSFDREKIFEEFRTVFQASGNNESSDLDRILYFDQKIYLPSLLHVDDRINMSVSLESRVPFLDHRIVEFAAAVPIKKKIKDFKAKNLLKETVKDLLPREIYNRTDKMGFNTPFEIWMKKDLRDFLFDNIVVSKKKGRGIWKTEKIDKLLKSKKKSYIIWNILCLELWFQNFIDA